MVGNTNTKQNAPNRPHGIVQVSIGHALVFGFTAAALVWTTWFVTHLPWLSLTGPARVAVIVLAWISTSTMLARSCTWLTAVTGGLISALLGLLILGSAGPELFKAIKSDPAVPSAVLIAAGFLGLGALVGLIGSVLSRALPRVRPGDTHAQFAVVTATTVAPLLFIGGLVTSTNSGMAVPDWPRTYGTNMFLYPLGGAGENIFLEHSHRLFGVLVGLSTLVLMAWTLIFERRRWVKLLAIIAFSLVVIQGGLGGIRVLENKRLFAMVHGVLAQLTFGTIVALAVTLSPTFKAVQRTEPLANPRKLRLFVTGALHATILQLIFGAMYRHFRDNHSLFTHAGFSMVVLVLMLMAGFAARSVAGEHGGLGKILRGCGRECLIVVLIQFGLGWLTFAAGGRAMAADGPLQALIRTIHQANGAAVLATIVVTFVWTKRLLSVSTASIT